MKVSMIVAVDRKGLIGKSDNTLPWKVPEDMKWFKEYTLDKAVLMGRNTWESIGRILPRRTNLVMSSKTANDPLGLTFTVDSFNKAINLSKYCGRDELVIIGGKQMYESIGIHKADRLILSIIKNVHEGDVYLDIPIINEILKQCNTNEFVPPVLDELEWDLFFVDTSNADVNFYILDRKQQRNY